MTLVNSTAKSNWGGLRKSVSAQDEILSHTLQAQLNFFISIFALANADMVSYLVQL